MVHFNDFVLPFSLVLFFSFLYFYWDYHQQRHQTALFEKEVLIENYNLAEPTVEKELEKKFDEVEIFEPQEGVFLPGTLNISKEEALRKCYIDPEFGDQHKGKNQCVVSEKYKLNFFLIPKTGSSTNRVAFRENLNGENSFCGQNRDSELRSYRNVITSRDPLSRFYSQYMEAEWRTSLNDNHRMAKLPFWKHTNLTERFFYFVNYWHENSLKEVLDTHLRLQAPMLSWFDGGVHRIDWIMPLEELTSKWQELKEELQLDFEPVLQKGRKNNEPTIKKKLIPAEYKRKICQIVAIDYCCLNYKLPDVCKGVVECEYTSRFKDLPSATKFIFPKVPKINFNEE